VLCPALPCASPLRGRVDAPGMLRKNTGSHPCLASELPQKAHVYQVAVSGRDVYS